VRHIVPLLATTVALLALACGGGRGLPHNHETVVANWRVIADNPANRARAAHPRARACARRDGAAARLRPRPGERSA